ncbi:MAG: hypothetical protein PHY48_15245 [Candidatus Cloacimonetes bacterium]|nr:hypothetical protein [Candidatus Cloacimonadota bacterium]
MEKGVQRIAVKVLRFHGNEVVEALKYMESCSTLLLDYQVIDTTLHSIFVIRASGAEDQVVVFKDVMRKHFGDNVTYIF